MPKELPTRKRSSRTAKLYLVIICTALSETGNFWKELTGEIGGPGIPPPVEERYSVSLQVKNQQGQKNG